MSTTFPLANNSVVQVTISGVAMDQLVQNRFDVLVENVTGTVNSSALLTSTKNVWAANISQMISEVFTHVEVKIQVVLDVIAGTSGPKRVYGNMDRLGPDPDCNGQVVGPALPYDVAMSVQLVTEGAPGPYWGKKSFGPLPATDLEDDGESVVAARLAAWEAASAAVFVSPHFLTASTATWTGVVVPGTAISRLALPHAPLNTLIKDILQTDVGTYIGSQATRRITPYSLRGH